MIKLGIIGTGAIAFHYMEALRWLNRRQIINVEIVAAVNRTEESNRKAKEELGIKRTYNNVIDMVSFEQLDGVIIAVPASSIYDVTINMIPFKIPLLIEKPPGLNRDQALHLACTAEKYQTSIMVGFNRRFYSVVRQAKSLITDAGALLGMRMDVFERLRMLQESQYPSEKIDQLFTTNSIHCIDLIRFYCGDPQSVHAFQNQIEIEPFNHRYSALIVSKSNIPITFQAYWHALGNWNYEIYIPDGKITFLNLEEARVHLRNKDPYNLAPDEQDIYVKPGFVAQLSYFIDDVISSHQGSMYIGELSIFKAVHTISLVEALENKKV